MSDRFDVGWSGPRDRRAVEYAMRTRTSYAVDGRQSYILVQGRTWFHEWTFDINKLRAANLASNAQLRDLHRQDTQLHTGTSVFVQGDRWRMCTRGKKLCSCAVYRDTYQTGFTQLRERKVTLQHRLDFNPNSDRRLERMRVLCDDIFFIHEMLFLVTNIEKLVLDESLPTWIWQDGIEDQMAIRTDMFNMWNLISDRTRELLGSLAVTSYQG